MFSDCTKSSTIKSKKTLDTVPQMCYTVDTVKGWLVASEHNLNLIQAVIRANLKKIKKIKKGIDT